MAALKRTIRKPLGAVAVAVPAFTRSLRLARTFTATAIGRPRAFLRLAADKIPGGGGTTIVRKAITYIFDD